MNGKRVIGFLLNIFLVIVMILCSVLFIIKISFIKVVVNGSSMNPTIENGSKGYMLKVTNATVINRFDVVAGKYGNSDDSYIIKRVLGLPNEQVELKDNELFVNGIEIPQDFSFIPRTTDFSTTSWTLGADEYLLVGDNRAATIQPVVENKSEILAKNGFAYLTYDINSASCLENDDYSSCEIEDRKWYFFKDGK